MNKSTRIFLVLFAVFMVILILNTMDQLNTPLVGNWTLITTNFINAMPYLMLIFLGLYFAIRR